MNIFIQALNNAVESKEGLLHFLTSEMGYRKNGIHVSTLDFLIQSKQDLNTFYSFFDGDWDSMSLLKSISRFKEHKIQMSRLSWEDFSDIFYFDPEDALETLFQSPCPQWQIEKLYEKFAQGLTLRHVYDTALKPEGYNFLWGYVSRKWGKYAKKFPQYQEPTNLPEYATCYLYDMRQNKYIHLYGQGNKVKELAEAIMKRNMDIDPDSSLAKGCIYVHRSVEDMEIMLNLALGRDVERIAV